LLREDSGPASFLIGLIVVVRVTVVIIVWLVLFLGVFLGYFTGPIIIVTAIAILYSVTDIGLFFTVRQHEQAREERQALLRKQRETGKLDTMD